MNTVNRVRSARVARVAGQVAPAALVVALVAALLPGIAEAAESATSESAFVPDVEAVLAGYNEGIRRTMAVIETLRVEQEMIEPTGDGGQNRALAVLTYRAGEGMTRDELLTDIGHPVGEYTLRSLVGPEILPSDYDVQMRGVEEMEGLSCHRLDVTAVERDRDHFDGTVWIDTEDLGPVRITGAIADPPFPVRRITLDKAFETVHGKLRLLRRHTGEIDIKLAFATRHGVMHIFYADYSFGIASDAPGVGTPTITQ